MVEGTGLENRHTSNGIESSNLSLSVLSEGLGYPSGLFAWWCREWMSGQVAEWFKAHAWKVCVR